METGKFRSRTATAKPEDLLAGIGGQEPQVAPPPKKWLELKQLGIFVGGMILLCVGIIMLSDETESFAIFSFNDALVGLILTVVGLAGVSFYVYKWKEIWEPVVLIAVGIVLPTIAYSLVSLQKDAFIAQWRVIAGIVLFALGISSLVVLFYKWWKRGQPIALLPSGIILTILGLVNFSLQSEKYVPSEINIGISIVFASCGILCLALFFSKWGNL